MNIETGEIKLSHELTEEMIKSGNWFGIPEAFANEADELMSKNETVDFYGDTPLSKWASKQRENVKKSRRKMAKKSKKANRKK